MFHVEQFATIDLPPLLKHGVTPFKSLVWTKRRSFLGLLPSILAWAEALVRRKCFTWNNFWDGAYLYSSKKMEKQDAVHCVVQKELACSMLDYIASNVFNLGKSFGDVYLVG